MCAVFGCGGDRGGHNAVTLCRMELFHPGLAIREAAVESSRRHAVIPPFSWFSRILVTKYILQSSNRGRLNKSLGKLNK